MEPYAGGVSGFYDEKICLWDLAARSGASVLDAQ
jgi:hypothetical protein